MVQAGTVKVLVLGSAGCGKSAIIQKFTQGAFPSEYHQTFGAELFVKSDQKKPSLHIWVTGGHERYRTLYGQFYLDASVALICFDLLSLSSFQELPFWYNEVKRNAPDAAVYLVGTKSDESDAMVIKAQDILKVTKDWNVEYKATSAKHGVNVEELFDTVYSKLSL